MRNLPIHAKTTQGQSSVILMTLQMTLQRMIPSLIPSLLVGFLPLVQTSLQMTILHVEESFEVMFVPEEEIQQVN